MAVAAESLAITVHDYMGMPQGPPYYQLIEGDLYMSPSPNWHHQKISRNIERAIDRYLEENPLGELFHAPLDVCLTEINVYQPDVLFFSEARKAILGERCIEGAPDFVVEILSESTAHLDKGQKRKIYARTGVKELWFVDPGLKEIAVFDLKKSAETPKATYSGKDKFGSPVFPGLKFSCAEIFRGI
jgi:Uma2 family endonuclease